MPAMGAACCAAAKPAAWVWSWVCVQQTEDAVYRARQAAAQWVGLCIGLPAAPADEGQLQARLQLQSAVTISSQAVNADQQRRGVVASIGKHVTCSRSS